MPSRPYTVILEHNPDDLFKRSFSVVDGIYDYEPDAAKEQIESGMYPYETRVVALIPGYHADWTKLYNNKSHEGYTKLAAGRIPNCS
jgi:hypothetical protein